MNETNERDQGGITSLNEINEIRK